MFDSFQHENTKTCMRLKQWLCWFDTPSGRIQPGIDPALIGWYQRTGFGRIHMPTNGRPTARSSPRCTVSV